MYCFPAVEQERQRDKKAASTPSSKGKNKGICLLTARDKRGSLPVPAERLFKTAISHRPQQGTSRGANLFMQKKSPASTAKMTGTRQSQSMSHASPFHVIQPLSRNRMMTM